MCFVKNIPDIVTALAAGIGAVVAVVGLNAWKKQLKGKTDYELARRYLRAVYKIRDAIKFVRNPFISLGEMEQALKERGSNQSTSDHKETSRAVYSVRWKKVTEAGSDLTLELREAEVSWGKDALNVEKDLETCITNLLVPLKMFLDFDSGTQNTDVIYDHGEEDAYNKKLNEAIKKIEDYLKPHLK